MGKTESRIPEKSTPSALLPCNGGLPAWSLRLVLLPLVFLGCAGAAQAQATGKLNDTGLVLCASNTSNSVTCSYADTDATGTWPRQDGQMGRAAKENTTGQTLTKTGASTSKGFDFQKLDAVSGTVVAAATAQGTTAGTWACTKDVVTGLIWDTKVTTASNARLNTSTYNWTNSNALYNGGVAGSTGTAAGTTCFSSTCDTEAFITHLNTLNLCGESANDWRLPTRTELMNLVDAAKQSSGPPAIDATYFPNMRAGRYWARDNVAANPNAARWVDLLTGADGISDKSNKYFVILVRP